MSVEAIIYIKSPLDREGVANLFSEHLESRKDLAVEIALSGSSESAALKQQDDYDFTAESNYLAEIYTDATLSDQQLIDFRELVAEVVITLRKSGAIAVVSCDFEDFIVSATGWNWTEGDQNQPNFSDKI